jgi:hypothetical protein
MAIKSKETKPAAKSKTAAIVKWEERFAGYAKKATDQVKGIGGSGTSVRFGRNAISIAGAPVKGGKLECVVVGNCAFNAWYEDDYDPNEITPPDCYAFAVLADDEDMAPHKDAVNKQHTTCHGCKQNEFGTAKRGKGKACGNKTKLALLVASDVDTAASVSTSELANAFVSPTNNKYWAAYVRELADEHGRPPWSVITEITSLDDEKNQIRLEFRMVDKIDNDEILTALEKRAEKVQDFLQVPYAAPVERAKKPAGKAAGASKKFAGKAGKR